VARAWRLQIVLLALVAVFIATAIALSWARGSDGWEAVARIEDLPATKPFYNDEHEVFVIRGPDGLLALSARGPWRHEKVEYCLSARWFEAPASGSRFDRYGRYYGGPAPQGMTRFPLRVEDRMIFVRPHDPITGPPRDGPTALEPEGPLCVPV
jgi:hypothetical protein